MPPKHWNFPKQVTDTLDALIVAYPHLSATAIHAELEKALKGTKDLPSLRTVQEYKRRSRPPDPLEEWKPKDWPGDDAGLVLSALAVMKIRLRETMPWPTELEAKRILWVCKTAPSMPPDMAWAVAMFYLMREARQESARTLDWFIGFGGWETNDDWKIYEEVMGRLELEQGIRYLTDLWLKYNNGQLSEGTDTNVERENSDVED